MLDGEGGGAPKDTFILAPGLASKVVPPTAVPIVSDAFQLARPASVVGSSVAASSGSGAMASGGSIPTSSAASGNGAGVPTNEYVVDESNEDDNCEEL